MPGAGGASAPRDRLEQIEPNGLPVARGEPLCQGRAVSIDGVIQHYGVIAILLGAGVEGEAVVVTGGALAHRGLIPLVPACIAAAAGSCAVDQLWFLAGRRFRDHRWVRAVTERPAFATAMRLFGRAPVAYVLAFRFVYGMRTISPVAIGTSDFPARRFVPLNMLAAAVWGPAFTLVGYAFGAAAERLLGRAAHWGLAALLAVVAAGLAAAAIAFGIRRWRAWRA